MEEDRIPVERREAVVVTEEPVPVLRRRQRVIRDTGAEQRLFTMKVINIIMLLFGILEALIGFRIVLKLIGANPDNGFANFVYDVTGVFLKPFAGLLTSPVVGDGILEWYSLIAMFIYAFLAFVIARLLWVVLYTPGRRVVQTVEEKVD